MANSKIYPAEAAESQALVNFRNSQAQLTAIIASAMDAIITIDDQHNILLFNAAAEEMFGYQADEIIGQSLRRLLPERFQKIHDQHIDAFGHTGVTNRAMGRLGTLKGRRSNGEEFPIEASISQTRIGDKKFFTVILRDISERVKAEEQMVENEQQLRVTFEQAPVGIAHLSREGHWMRVNQKMVDITGYSREELLGMTYMEMTHPEDLPTDQNLHEKVFAGVLPTYTREKRFIRKDGSIIWGNVTVSLVRDNAGEPKYLIKIIEDITDRKAAEAALVDKTDQVKTMTQQLWQAAKLATMGELAASIAHELNNPLAILSLRLESVMASLPESIPEQRELQVIAEEADRMASLVGNLLQFSRSNRRQVSSIDVRDEINQTLELVHSHMLHRHISIHRDFAQEIPLIQADRQQLRQLFLNLFTNASDAMPNGGDLYIRVDPADDAHKILVEIKDTGVGIASENIQQVMEPFYTTKPEGKGTGLGLSICRRIVEEHQGNLLLYSPGKDQGTVIRITLPASSEAGQHFID